MIYTYDHHRLMPTSIMESLMIGIKARNVRPLPLIISLPWTGDRWSCADRTRSGHQRRSDPLHPSIKSELCGPTPRSLRRLAKWQDEEAAGPPIWVAVAVIHARCKPSLIPRWTIPPRVSGQRFQHFDPALGTRACAKRRIKPASSHSNAVIAVSGCRIFDE